MNTRLVLITCPGEHAPSLAQGMVESRLAACVNVLPEIQSIYRWEEKVTSDHESLLVVKTTGAAIERLAAFVREHHPYAVPEFVVITPEQVGETYAAWIAAAVGPM